MNDLNTKWKDKLKYKLKATSIHLLLSLLIFAVILYFIVFEWYPEALFTADGGLAGIKLMAAIHLVLGPGLTFIVYNHNKAKKEIVFDLSIIVLLQISALTWGSMQVYKQRPVALVFWEDTFYTVTQDYFEMQNVSVNELQTFDLNRPAIIYAEHPKSVQALEMMLKLVDEKIPPYAQYHLYRNYHQNLQDIFSYEVADVLLNASIRQKLKQLEDRHEDGKVYVLPVTAKYKNIVLFMNEAGVVLGTEASDLASMY